MLVLTRVVGVRFRKVGRVYDFDPNGLELKQGVPVIVDTQKGLEYGICAGAPREVEDERIVPPLRKVERLATEEDAATVQSHEEKEQQAVEIFRKRAEAHKLVMKLVDVEYAFDGARIIFFFTADGRVDFRDLVKDLAAVFRTRIELRQVGVRDEAKMTGGLGICGRPFCCAEFLSEFQPVSIKMAKEQSLSLNPAKISGTCGRLMCCLKYEQEAYEDLIATTPKVDSVVQTPMGPGVVTDVSLLRGNLNVRLDEAPDTPRVFHKSELGAGRQKPMPPRDGSDESPKGSGEAVRNAATPNSQSQKPPFRRSPPRDVPPRENASRGLPARGLPTRDLPARDLPARDLPARDLPARDLPARDLPARDLPARDLPARDLPVRDSSTRDLPVRDSAASGPSGSRNHARRTPQGANPQPSRPPEPKKAQEPKRSGDTPAEERHVFKRRPPRGGFKNREDRPS